MCSWDPGRQEPALDIEDANGTKWHRGCIKEINPEDHFCEMCWAIKEGKKNDGEIVRTFKASEEAWEPEHFRKPLKKFWDANWAFRDACGIPRVNKRDGFASGSSHSTRIAAENITLHWELFLTRNSKVKISAQEVLEAIREGRLPPKDGEVLSKAHSSTSGRQADTSPRPSKTRPLKNSKTTSKRSKT
jgi:hypothetical protein